MRYWIACRDELPPLNTLVLVTFEETPDFVTVSMLVMCSEERKKVWTTYFDFPVNLLDKRGHLISATPKYTHWSPMIEPMQARSLH